MGILQIELQSVLPTTKKITFNCNLATLVSICTCYFLGVTSMVMLQPDELIVGSGDGNVCIVKDQTLKPSLFKKPTHDGVPKQITEPTKPCLVEVKILTCRLVLHK